MVTATLKSRSEVRNRAIVSAVLKGNTFKDIAQTFEISKGQVSKIFSRYAVEHELSVPKRIWSVHRKLRGSSGFDLGIPGVPDKWTTLKKKWAKRKRAKVYLPPGAKREARILKLDSQGMSAINIGVAVGVDRQVVYQTLRRLRQCHTV